MNTLSEISPEMLNSSTSAEMVLNTARIEAAALVDAARAEAAALVERAAVVSIEKAAREAIKIMEAAHEIHLMGRAVPPSRPSRATTLLKWASITTLVGAMLLMLIPLWWMFSPHTGMTTFTLTSHPGPVAAGGIYTWDVSYCLDTDTPTSITIHRELELVGDHTRFSLPSIFYTSVQRCETFERSTVLPRDMPPGPYQLVAHTELRYNPLRVVTQNWDGDTFTVIAK